MDLLETLDKNKGKALTALAALAVMAGTAVATKKVPVHGLETILSSFGKEGKLVRNVANSLVEKGFEPASLAGREFISNALENVGGRTASPLLKSTSIIKDRQWTNNVGNLIKEVADTNTPSASIRRLNTSLNVPRFDPITGEQKLINLLGNNRATNIDLNNPAIADAALLSLTSDAAKNYELQTRIANLAAKKSMPGNAITKQLNFIKDFKGNQMAVREDLMSTLRTEAEKLSQQTGISTDEAYNRLSNAFSSVSPRNDFTTNEELFNNVLSDYYNGATKIRTGTGVFHPNTGNEIQSPVLQKQDRALQALRGLFSGDKKVSDLSKVEQMAAVLSGKNGTVLDTAELEKMLVGLSEKERSAVINALYNRGKGNKTGNKTYSALNDALDQVVSSGNLGNVARVMTGSKDKALNRFLYQGGLERRAALGN
jgi:hypothetical protein